MKFLFSRLQKHTLNRHYNAVGNNYVKFSRVKTHVWRGKNGNFPTSFNVRYFTAPKVRIKRLNVIRIPQKRLLKQTLYARVYGTNPIRRPRTRWLDYVKDRGWNRLGVCASEMQSVMANR